VKGRGEFLLSFFSVFLSASSADAGTCLDFLKQLKAAEIPSPREVEGALFHNQELAAHFLSQNFNEAVPRAIEDLKKNGTLKIQIDEEGFVVAADSRGSYSKAVWARDMARVAGSLVPAERKKVIGALLKMMSLPLNRELFALNIRVPHAHKAEDGELKTIVAQNWKKEFEGIPIESSMFVPHIRFLRAQISDSNIRPERWNMKQNDGLALVFLESLRALEDGIISWDDLSPEQKSYFSYFIAYGMRVQFWEKFDAGAWEEGNGRRTSSVGLMTSAFQRFLSSPLRSKIEEDLKTSPLFANDLRAIMQNEFKPEYLQQAIRHGKEIVLAQIKLGEVPERFEPGAKQGRRFSDAALAHLLWYPPDFFSEHEFQVILEHLLKLRRASGIIRYEGDVYLILGQFLGSMDDEIPAELLRDRDKHLKVGLIQEAFWTKNSGVLEAAYGPYYEAQWTLGDAILVQFLPRLIQLFPQSMERPRYEKLLKESVLRLFGSITGQSAGGEGPLALDGKKVNSWAIPEAYIPVRLFKADGRVETRWVTSQFTPLNWATAELRLGIASLEDYLKNFVDRAGNQ